MCSQSIITFIENWMFLYYLFVLSKNRLVVWVALRRIQRSANRNDGKSFYILYSSFFLSKETSSLKMIYLIFENNFNIFFWLHFFYYSIEATLLFIANKECIAAIDNLRSTRQSECSYWLCVIPIKELKKLAVIASGEVIERLSVQRCTCNIEMKYYRLTVSIKMFRSF